MNGRVRQFYSNQTQMRERAERSERLTPKTLGIAVGDDLCCRRWKKNTD